MSIEELIYILKTRSPSTIIRESEEEVFKLIPELEECKGFDQHNEEWHPYDVYEHILRVVDNVENDEVLRMSALFHDLGKPQTFELDKYGIGHFSDHWFISKDIFEDFAEKHSYDKTKAKEISNIIRFHDLNLGKVDGKLKEEVINSFDKEGIIKLFKLKRADLLAQSKEKRKLLKDYDKQEKAFKLIYERRNTNE